MEQQHDTGTIELATVKDREELLDLLYRVFTHKNPTHPRMIAWQPIASSVGTKRSGYSFSKRGWVGFLWVKTL